MPDAILNKPAALTDDEYEQMKRHSLLGCDIVEAADMPDEARWVRHHHERFDGTGYPDRLAGEEIPLESRIILVADAFEAMTSDRPYRTRPARSSPSPSYGATRARSSTRGSSTRCAARSTAGRRLTSSRRSRSVALLELLARPAPARVVAAELLVLVDAPLLHHG